MAINTPKLRLPVPEADDNNDVPGDLLRLAQRIEAVPGIESLTTAHRDALAEAQRWPGRVIYNTTSGLYERWTGTTWAPLVDTTKTIRLPHTWHVPGDVLPISGTENHVLPFAVPVSQGQTARLVSLRRAISHGTSATFSLLRRNANGQSSIVSQSLLATVNRAQTNFNVELASNDELSLQVTSVEGAPFNLWVTAYIDYVV